MVRDWEQERANLLTGFPWVWVTQPSDRCPTAAGAEQLVSGGGAVG